MGRAHTGLIQELENERIQGLCSLDTELEGALRGSGMNMAMGEELLAVKRDINKRVRAYGESPNMRELAKRYSDIEQRM